MTSNGQRNSAILKRQPQSQTSLHFRDVNNQTKEYLGYPVSDDQRNDLDTSSTNSDYESDSDDVYQAGIERSPRIAPQITEPDDEIYGEFDPNIAIQNEIMVRNHNNCSCLLVLQLARR